MRRALGVIGVVCGLWLPAAAPAWAGVTEGTLVTSDEKGGVVEVPLDHTEVRIRVAGWLAEVDVTQTFKNPYARKIEAIYAFPLPTGAAVSRMSLKTGDEVVTGEVKRRADAAAVYRLAKDGGRVAALLEEERANLFTQSVANIEPGARVEVSLHYVQELPYDHGSYELVFPLVASPRYVPAKGAPGAKAGPAALAPTAPAAAAAGAPALSPAATKVPAAAAPLFLPAGVRSSHDVDLTVDLDAAVPMKDLRSPSHKIAVSGATAHGARVTLGAGDKIPNKDFVLRWDVAGDAPTAAMVAHRGEKDAKGSFFLMIAPPADAAAMADVAPRELVFVIDTSSSMAGKPLAKAKEVVRASLAALRPDDTFQVMRFSDAASALGAAPLPATAKEVKRATAWVGGLAAAGGTAMIDGVRAALEFPHDPRRLRLVLFVTDGYVGNEDDVLATVHAKLGAARLFSFGVGTAVNRYLLEELAAFGRGAAEIVRPDEDTAAAVARFEARIAAPVLTDLTIDWKGLGVEELVPAAPPDLFLGQPLVLYGRYTKPGKATIALKGKLGGKAVSLPVAVELPARRDEDGAVAAVWAKAKIRELSRSLIRKDDPAVVEAITSLALQHRLLSRWTSFVAVSAKKTDGGPAVAVPVPLDAPEGLVPAAAGVDAAGAPMDTITIEIPADAPSTPAGKTVTKPAPKMAKAAATWGGAKGGGRYDAPTGDDGGGGGGGGGGGDEADGYMTADGGGSGYYGGGGGGGGGGSGSAPKKGMPSRGGGGGGKGGGSALPKPKSASEEKLSPGTAAAAATASLASAVRDKYASAMRGCWASAAARKVPVGKGLPVSFTVGADGAVVSATVAGPKDAALETCVATAAKDGRLEMKFGAKSPAAAHAYHVAVTY
ncbi:MAG TPA: VIT domain-containing protein [Myxococcota bacterium]|jgi:Ca-activated chloride channel family protein|nr:VIT domain-containing protein [Myxococcota bacterium]